jgi:two-component system, OmpR family, response regulator ChvI
MDMKQDSVATGASASSSGANIRIVFVEDDDLFRESMARNLADAGFSVTDFGSGPAALQFLTQGGSADLALLDWRMPEMSGIELFQKLKEEHVELPVIFLTSLGDQVYEETALINGAVDFIDKSKSLSIILNRIGSVATNAKVSHVPVLPGVPQAAVRRGDLELCLNSNRAFWKSKRVNLTLAEFKIVHHLATQMDRDVSHREIYDIVRGPGFMAGEGENGYRANVRTFIKRIRQKFGEVDDRFDRIATYSGFGYRWASDSEVVTAA